ncbi:glycoside hydrolase family 113 [Rhodocaloribacter sp.]
MMIPPRLAFLRPTGLLLAGGGLMLALVLGALGRNAAPPEAAHIRGITLDARRPPADATLTRLHDLGVTHVTVIPYAFQPSKDRSEIRHNPDGHWYSESDAGIRDLAGRLNRRGIKLILKPQIWLRGGAWTADIAFETEADWQKWEAEYRRFIMHYARLAAETGAALLVVGTELATPVRTREAFWRGLIADVRAVYGGKLTYAANWHEDFEHVPFWDALDFVGVQAYFPITEASDPSLETLKAGWKPHLEALARVSRRTGRPVLLTELGYRSVPYAAAEPWRWPSRNEDRHVAPDFELQARLFEAFFEQCWSAPWLAGAIIWKWHPDARGSRNRDLNFTPQGKPAERVIRQWFTQ